MMQKYTIKGIPKNWDKNKVNEFFIDVLNLLGLEIHSDPDGTDEFVEKYKDALEEVQESEN